MIRPRFDFILGAALLASAAPTFAADPLYSDPWDAATVKASEAAVARLGAERGLDLVPSILQILGVEGGVAGQGSGIVATVQEVRQAMKSLHAEETALEVRVALPADVLFDFDKADIRADAVPALAHLATLIRAYPSGRVDLEGHTDAKGEAAYNQRLSLRRAESVEQWLVEREGIAADRFITHGLGEARPVAGNEDEAGRQRNRRVEVVIHKQ